MKNIRYEYLIDIVKYYMPESIVEIGLAIYIPDDDLFTEIKEELFS